MSVATAKDRLDPCRTFSSSTPARTGTHTHTTLGLVPSAFFSVCLTAADDTHESRIATRKYLDEFVEATGRTPDRSTTFAGALQYREYEFVTRLLIRLMMHKMHHPTDTSRDYDYTDWDAVERFAHECVPLPQARTPAAQ